MVEQDEDINIYNHLLKDEDKAIYELLLKEYDNSKHVNVMINTEEGIPDILFDISPLQNFEKIKKEIEKGLGIPISRQRLYYEKQEMPENDTLLSHGFHHSSKKEYQLDLKLKLRKKPHKKD